MGVATIAQAPEWALTPAEANNLSKASVEVLKLYNFDIGPEAVAWSNLFIALAGVYGPRVAATMLRLKMEKAKNVTPPATASSFAAPVPVVPFPDGAPPPPPPAASMAGAGPSGQGDHPSGGGNDLGPAFFK